MIQILNQINRKLIYIGYILIGIAINGLFGVYLVYDNLGTPGWAWYISAIIAGIIIALKTYKFPEARIKIIFADLIFITILLTFALISMPRGINFIIGSIIAVGFIYYFIDKSF